MNIPIPYSLKADDGIAILLLICFFFSAYVLARSKKVLHQQSNRFFSHKEKSSTFVASTDADIRYLLLLVIQTCLLTGVCFFNYFNSKYPLIAQQTSPYITLGIYSLVCMAYIAVKWMIYVLLGWVLFDKNKTNIWMESYSTIIYYLGFVLFPFVLLIIYFDLSAHIMTIIALCFIIFAKLLIFYKWLKLFFNNIYGLLLLILYFCAVEIIPCFIFYQVLIKINNLLLLKF